MRYIPTSAVVVEKLKQAAKQAKRKYKIPHSEALNRVARGEGYDHWHHVTLCARENHDMPDGYLCACLGRLGPRSHQNSTFS